MTDDIFDTRFEGKKVEIKDNVVALGDVVNLTTKDPALRNILIGSGWDLNAFDGDTLDVDLSLFLLNRDMMTRVDEDFVFYNQPETCEGGVKHMGDSRTGAGDGDDEVIAVDLQSVPFDILQIYIVASIYNGYEKEQSFGMVRNTYLRVVNADTLHELCRYELDDEFKDNNHFAGIIGVLSREGAHWHFKPAAEFVEGGLAAIAQRFGLIINQ